MGSAIRCGVCSTCHTFRVLPDFAGDGLGHARVVSLRRVLFSFFRQNYRSDPWCIFVPVDTYQVSLWHLTCNNRSGWTGMFNSMIISSWRFDSHRALPFFRARYVFHLRLCGVVWCHNGVTLLLGPDVAGIILLYGVPGIIYLACVYVAQSAATAAAAAVLLLLLFCTGVVAAAACCSP